MDSKDGTFWISFSRTPSVMNLIFVSLVTFPSYRIWYDTILNSRTNMCRLSYKFFFFISKFYIPKLVAKRFQNQKSVFLFIFFLNILKTYRQWIFLTVWTGSSLWPLCGTCWQLLLFLALWYLLFHCHCKKNVMTRMTVSKYPVKDLWTAP